MTAFRKIKDATFSGSRGGASGGVAGNLNRADVEVEHAKPKKEFKRATGGKVRQPITGRAVPARMDRPARGKQNRKNFQGGGVIPGSAPEGLGWIPSIPIVAGNGPPKPPAAPPSDGGINPGKAAATGTALGRAAAARSGKTSASGSAGKAGEPDEVPDEASGGRIRRGRSSKRGR